MTSAVRNTIAINTVNSVMTCSADPGVTMKSNGIPVTSINEPINNPARTISRFIG